MNKSVNALQAVWMRPNLIWDRVNKDGTCWVWRGRLNRDGYGSLDAGGTSILAHRATYFVATGYLNMDDSIRHTCDNPACCNPAHLIAGTHADNMADMRERGRRKGVGIGVDNGRAKLTPSAAERIRVCHASGELLRTLAARYGVSKSTISRVISRESWNG